MPKVDLLQTNFVGGELSPRLYGRPDLQRYNDSLKRARDVVIYQHGGARGRPGTDYVGAVKTSSKSTRLVPFVFSATDAYLLEFGDLYIRVWRDGSMLVEVTSPYTEAQIFDLDYSQGADTMFIVHPSVAPQRLQRWSDTRWVIEACPFDPVPFDEVGLYANIAITLGAVTGSTTATAGASLFLASDVGRTISYLGGIAAITVVNSATSADVTVSSDFSTVSLPGNGWRINGSPQTTCTPTDKDPVGKVTTLTLGAAGWRSTDVGKFVTLNGGLLEITAYSSGTAVSARILSELAHTTAAEASAWTLESAAWNAVDGYPRAVTLFEQRAVYAGTSRDPQTLWASRIGLYYDFTKGVLDDDAYSYDIQSDEVNPILYLSSGRDLAALTYGGVWVFAGGLEKPITPTNVRARQQGKNGADDVRPEQVDEDLYYVQRSRERLRSLWYQTDLQSYDDDEASQLFQHLTSGLAGMTYQATPERVLWAWKDDGTFLGITCARKQNGLRAPALCTIAGSGVVESMATIPEDGEDATYLIVRRTVNGSTARYIERLTWDTYLDSQKTVTLSPASDTVTGLSHLEGLEVAAVADGVDIGDFTVASGSITITRDADEVIVGLRFTPTLKLLQPEFGTGMGAALGMATARGETRVLLSGTIGCSVNGEALPFRQFGADLLDSPIDPFTGWLSVSGLGIATDSGEIELTQPQAYPWAVLAVVRKIVANPG